jgi:glycosyltransferase involved in cell wall biosynthesis
MRLSVVMITRSTLYRIPGGDTVQVTETASHLRKLGVNVDIKLTDESIVYEKYNLIHFFNLIRPADMMIHIRRSGKPYLISTIFVDFSEFDRVYRKGISGLIFRLFSSDAIEYIKTISRWIKGVDKLMSKDFIWKGQRSSVQELLANASLILPNSENEYLRLKARYRFSKDHMVIPNGVNRSWFILDSTKEKDPKMVLCVARIEGVKNQLNLIKALNGTDFQLYLIGAPTPNQPNYLKACELEAGNNIHFLGHLTTEAIQTYYQTAKIHILPSWFETTGLSSLEAAAMGCQVIISDRGDAKEYFTDLAYYCNPVSTESILAAIQKASIEKIDPKLREKVVAKFCWENAASETLQGYLKVIKN